MPDEIITPEMAGVLHRCAMELSDIAVWGSEQEPDHPGILVARLITDAANPDVLTPPTLRSERQPA
ncbi:MAG: hypothetical protein ACREQ5_26635, partial [Candidatus Dormibacteria bacterium]